MPGVETSQSKSLPLALAKLLWEQVMCWGPLGRYVIEKESQKLREPETERRTEGKPRGTCLPRRAAALADRETDKWAVKQPQQRTCVLTGQLSYVTMRTHVLIALTMYCKHPVTLFVSLEYVQKQIMNKH